MAKSNLNVLITRPEPFGQRLAQQLKLANIHSVCQPVLYFKPSLRLPKYALDSYDFVFFISVAAVDFSAEAGQLSSLQTNRSPTKVFAVGSATQAALKKHRIHASSPKQHDTEGLLALSPLAQEHVAGQKILIVRGDGGRECLATQLKKRGGLIEYWESYQRAWLSFPEGIAEHWQHLGINVIVITSNNILKFVVKLLKRADNYWENNSMLIVVSERIAHEATALGFRHVIEAQGASDRAIVNAICQIGKDS